MRIVIVHCFIIILALICVQEEASCQVFYPAYGAVPNSDAEDDDLGLILTVLLFAAKQRSYGFNNGYYTMNGPCTCCNNCRSSRKTIPIPYPVPYPINNAVIYKSKSNEDTEDKEESSDDDSGDNTDQGSEEMNLHATTESDESSSRNTTVKYKPELVSESVEVSYD